MYPSSFARRFLASQRKSSHWDAFIGVLAAIAARFYSSALFREEYAVYFCTSLLLPVHFCFNGLWGIQMSFMCWKRAIVARTHSMLTVTVCMVRNLFALELTTIKQIYSPIFPNSTDAVRTGAMFHACA